MHKRIDVAFRISYSDPVEKLTNGVLTPFELNLWAIHRGVFTKFNVYTAFRWNLLGPDSANTGYLQWYVPDPCPQQEDVLTYLSAELCRLESTINEFFPRNSELHTAVDSTSQLGTKTPKKPASKHNKKQAVRNFFHERQMLLFPAEIGTAS